LPGLQETGQNNLFKVADSMFTNYFCPNSDKSQFIKEESIKPPMLKMIEAVIYSGQAEEK
jgi:hypothetical protein